MTQTEVTKPSLGTLKSRRIGRAGGQSARTFHCDFGSIRVGSKATPNGAFDVLLCEGREKREAAELEHVSGDPAVVRRAAKLVEAAAVRRRGPQAERVLVRQTIELPVDTTAAQRREVAEMIASDWVTRGHPAIVAVHGNDLVQPHLRVLVSARPVTADGEVDRSRRLWAGKQAVRDERSRIAGMINRACNQRVAFHPGRLADTGIHRKAERRIPRAIWEVGQRELDSGEVDRVRAEKEAERAERRAHPAKPSPLRVALAAAKEDVETARKESSRQANQAAEQRRRAEHAEAYLNLERERRARVEAELLAVNSQLAGLREHRAAELAAAQDVLRGLTDHQKAQLADSRLKTGHPSLDFTTIDSQLQAWNLIRQLLGLWEP